LKPGPATTPEDLVARGHAAQRDVDRIVEAAAAPPPKRARRSRKEHAAAE
jgi:hypothetical protein